MTTQHPLHVTRQCNKPVCRFHAQNVLFEVHCHFFPPRSPSPTPPPPIITSLVKRSARLFFFSFFSFSSYGPRVGTTLWRDHKLWWETKWTTCCDCTVGRMCFISELLSQLLSLAQSGGFSRWQVCMTDITRPVPAGTYILTMYSWLHRRTQNKGFTFYQVRDVLTSKEAARKWFHLSRFHQPELSEGVVVMHIHVACTCNYLCHLDSWRAGCLGDESCLVKEHKVGFVGWMHQIEKWHLVSRGGACEERWDVRL